MRPVTSGTTPIHPQGVCGPTKTRLISTKPSSTRMLRSIVPAFLVIALFTSVGVDEFGGACDVAAQAVADETAAFRLFQKLLCARFVATRSQAQHRAQLNTRESKHPFSVLI